MSIVDYANRKYDYLALRNVKRVGESQLGLALFTKEDTGQIAVGAQKLAQRWLLEFLTEIGSMPGLSNRGTNFMRKIRLGRVRSFNDMQLLFNFAEAEARLNLRNEEDDTWPLDERLKLAALTALEFLPGYADLTVTITSLAGTARSIIVPISTLPQNIG